MKTMIMFIIEDALSCPLWFTMSETQNAAFEKLAFSTCSTRSELVEMGHKLVQVTLERDPARFYNKD